MTHGEIKFSLQVEDRPPSSQTPLPSSHLQSRHFDSTYSLKTTFWQPTASPLPRFRYLFKIKNYNTALSPLGAAVVHGSTYYTKEEEEAPGTRMSGT
ncbi:hypothetical protein INR49_021112 [Caranx melampygus]|nr:hypothetical protein INR49_021112 [Caranx melampygus]